MTESFNGDAPKEFTVQQICEDIHNELGSLFEEYYFKIDENDISDHISSGDFEEEFSNSYKDYEYDSNDYNVCSANVMKYFEIF